MRIAIPLFATLLLLGITSCDKDDDDTQPVVNPTIQFRSDSGFVFQSDTVPVQDTLRVGVSIDRGTQALHHFKVSVSYDGAAAAVTDSLPVGTDEFEFTKTIITRPQPGVEKWNFSVIENDGDVIFRSLTFTVVE